MKFYVIGDEDTVLGFNLVGIEGDIVQTPEEVKASLQKTFQMKDMGIIIISERLASSARELVNQYMYKTTFPLIIEIPDRLGPLERKGTVRDMIRSAIGVRL